MNKLISYCLSLIAYCVSLITYCFIAKPVLAGQYGQYGEVQISKNLSLDKKVLKPNGDWVDNLFLSDYKFAPSQEVQFKLMLTNTGNATLENIKVKDTLPNFLELVSGALEFSVAKLEAGQTYTSEVITAKVLSIDKLPGDYGNYCIVNIAESWVDDQADRDTAQICIEKKVLGFVSLPKAGPAENLAIMLGSVLVFGAGFWAFKKSY